MADRISLKIDAAITLTPELLARAWCEMDDDAQAQFFVHAARIQESWPAHARIMQRHYVGRHLAECACSTDEARELVADIFSSMQPNPDAAVREALIRDDEPDRNP